MKKLVLATTSQMREIDRVVTQEYGLQIVQMMENAGGGLAAARNLRNWGADVEVALAVRDDSLKRSVVAQFNVLESMRVPFVEASTLRAAEIQGFDLIVDALLGYGIDGDPAAEFAHVISLTNESKKPVVALDIPSGLDASSGKPFDPCIKASATMALAVPKTGLLESTAAEFVGELWLADIGIPPEVLVKVGLEGENPFIEDDLVLLHRMKKAVAITA